MRHAVLALAVLLGACTSMQYQAADPGHPPPHSAYAASQYCVRYSTSPITAARYASAESQLAPAQAIAETGGAIGGLMGGLMTSPALEQARADAMDEFHACMARFGWMYRG